MRAVVLERGRLDTVIGAGGSVTAGIGVLIVNSKIDRLTGRVDAHESTMQTVHTPIAGRPVVTLSQPRPVTGQDEAPAGQPWSPPPDAR